MGWSNLKAALLGYFKPADYAFKTRQALSKWTQRGSITDYIVCFSEWYTQCADVNKAEALFCFLDGLQGDIQAWVRMYRPIDLSSTMQMAEQIRSTFA